MPTARGAAVTDPTLLPINGLADSYNNVYQSSLHSWGTTVTESILLPHNSVASSWVNGYGTIRHFWGTSVTAMNLLSDGISPPGTGSSGIGSDGGGVSIYSVPS